MVTLASVEGRGGGAAWEGSWRCGMTTAVDHRAESDVATTSPLIG
jgi:hypothetical protein